MDSNRMAKFQMSETLKALLRILLLLVSACLPYYFRLVLGMEVDLADFLYAPVILAVLWWPTGGTLVGLSLSLLLPVSHLFVEPATPLLHNLQRGLTLFAIALVMSVLSRQTREAEQEVRQRSQELSALNAIAFETSQSLDLDEILKVTFDKVLETLGAEAGGIYLLDERGGELVAKVYRGVSPEFVEETTGRDGSLAGQVLRSGEPIVIEDLSERPELTQIAAEVEGLHAYISVPLKSSDKMLGVMDVITPNRRFASQDAELLTSIGNQTGVAIDKARLFEETKRRLRESETLFQVGKALTSVLDLERLLQLITDSAVEAIGPAERGVIHLLDEASGEIHPQALAGKALGALKERKMRVGEGIAGLVIEEGETINVSDINADPRFLRDSPEFQSLLVAPLLIGEKRIGTISVDSEEVDAFGPDDERLLATLASQAAIAIKTARLFKELRHSFVGIIAALAAAIDAKDPYTHGHSERVARYAAEMARELGLEPHEVETIRYAGLLHDIGKIGIGERTLHKPGALDVVEWDAMKVHPVIGARILEPIPLLKDIVPLVYHHHEHCDGTGYPDGLAGAKTPLGARILAVADAFEAMTSHRPYRRALSLAQTIALLQDGMGKQWDAEVVEAFLRTLEKEMHCGGGERLSIEPLRFEEL